MTADTWTQLATPIAMIILIVVQKRDSAKAAKKVDEVKEDLKGSSSKRDNKLEVIHQLVNGGLSEAKQEIKLQRLEIERLHELVKSSRK